MFIMVSLILTVILVFFRYSPNEDPEEYIVIEGKSWQGPTHQINIYITLLIFGMASDFVLAIGIGLENPNVLLYWIFSSPLRTVGHMGIGIFSLLVYGSKGKPLRATVRYLGLITAASLLYLQYMVAHYYMQLARRGYLHVERAKHEEEEDRWQKQQLRLHRAKKAVERKKKMQEYVESLMGRPRGDNDIPLARRESIVPIQEESVISLYDRDEDADEMSLSSDDSADTGSMDAAKIGNVQVVRESLSSMDERLSGTSDPEAQYLKEYIDYRHSAKSLNEPIDSIYSSSGSGSSSTDEEDNPRKNKKIHF